ncbi:unnamed protein product [Bursaphelenchus okinawaensis]|uniref:Uncharacterized protein n=1 Tax=Bursaphelenchus okinawaensis TaxID=465554 RepID=A0A811JSG3_9BILA|nr:unnamed protein product [Bursaphelenchus okinawaensis]CAG9080468.1 unnamed protein product [Bursaphelenchus okinawaensis]
MAGQTSEIRLKRLIDEHTVENPALNVYSKELEDVLSLLCTEFSKNSDFYQILNEKIFETRVCAAKQFFDGCQAHVASEASTTALEQNIADVHQRNFDSYSDETGPCSSIELMENVKELREIFSRAPTDDFGVASKSNVDNSEKNSVDNQATSLIKKVKGRSNWTLVLMGESEISETGLFDVYNIIVDDISKLISIISSSIGLSAKNIVFYGNKRWFSSCNKENQQSVKDFVLAIIHMFNGLNNPPATKLYWLGFPSFSDGMMVGEEYEGRLGEFNCAMSEIFKEESMFLDFKMFLPYKTGDMSSKPNDQISEDMEEYVITNAMDYLKTKEVTFFTQCSEMNIST